MSDFVSDLEAELAGLVSGESRRAGVSALLDALSTRPGERPEELLLDLKLVDDVRLALGLALQSGRRFEGLRAFRPDPRLFLYLPLVIAERERVVPLLLVGDTLTLATTYLDPDLSYLRENFPNLAAELVVSPRSEILDALRRVDM